MAKVEVYSTPVCGHCRKAKALLTAMDIPYVEYNIYESVDAMNVMREGHHTTVPQIFIDDVLIGGYDDLLEMQKDGALECLLEDEKE